VYEFWNKLGLLLFIIGVAGLWGNYSIEGIRLFYGLMLIIGTLLNLMPKECYENINVKIKNIIKKGQNEN
jgi:hypothetical protein